MNDNVNPNADQSGGAPAPSQGITLLRVHPSDTPMEVAAKVNTNFSRLGGRLEDLASADPRPNAAAPNAPGISHLEGSLDADAHSPMRPVAGVNQDVLRGTRPDNAPQANPLGVSAAPQPTHPAETLELERPSTAAPGPQPAPTAQNSADARDRLGLT